MSSARREVGRSIVVGTVLLRAIKPRCTRRSTLIRGGLILSHKRVSPTPPRRLPRKRQITKPLRDVEERHARGRPGAELARVSARAVDAAEVATPGLHLRAAGHETLERD